MVSKKDDLLIVRRGGRDEVGRFVERTPIGNVVRLEASRQDVFVLDPDLRSAAEGDCDAIRDREMAAALEIEQLRASLWAGGGPVVYTA